MINEVPRWSLQINALTDERNDPTSAVQYAVRSGAQYDVYGDQEWVAYGQALQDLGSGGAIYQREITITYGPWVAVGMTLNGDKP